jgi:hypothetical protein
MTAPAMAATGQGAPTTKAPANGKQVQIAVRPFPAGTREVDKATYDPGARALTANTQDLPSYECDPNGFLRGAYILVECTASGNSAAVAFQPDAPQNVIDTITFNDVNNKPIVGPMGGHDLYEAIKFGGYTGCDDSKSSVIYSVTTGTGATGGSFTFALRLPVEIVKRDALGSLPNKSASATFTINIRLAALATVYSTQPTAAPTVRVRIQQFGWMDPNGTDMRGNPVAQNPPGVQTTQYWSKQTYNINSGAFNIRLLGLDSLIRNFIFILLDSTPSRQTGDSDFPDPFAMIYETAQPIQRLKTIWRHMIAEQFRYKNAVETADGRDYGVYPVSYCQDMTETAGQETRLNYLPCSSGTTVSINGTIGGSGAHTLIVLVNKIVPANGDPLVLTGR